MIIDASFIASLVWK